MTVSIIVPTYNRPLHLAKALSGYLDQTCPPTELLVADDGSGTETKAVVREFARKARFPVHHVWQGDRGWRKPRILNRAALESTGDYLITTDDDCLPGPHFIEDHRLMMEPGCFVHGKRIFVGPEATENITGREDFFRLLGLLLAGQIRKWHLLVRIPGWTVRLDTPRGTRGCNFALFREDLERVNGWDERFSSYGREDTDLSLRLMRAGCVRKTALFSAVVFHLHHETAGRGEAVDNDPLLEQSRNGPVFTPYGMVRRNSSA